MSQIRIRKTELLRQENALLKRQNDLLREQFASAQALIEDQQEAAECPECDIPALAKKREYLEHRTKNELRIHSGLCGQKLAQRARAEGKTSLLCRLQELQLWKVQLAEAELAGVVAELWGCKTRDFEDCIDALMCNINTEVAACPENVDPYLADAINQTLKDC